MLLCFFSVELLALWYHDIWRTWSAGSMFQATLDIKGLCFCCILLYFKLPQWLLVYLATKHINHQTNLDLFCFGDFLRINWDSYGFITITPPVGRVLWNMFQSSNKQLYLILHSSFSPQPVFLEPFGKRNPLSYYGRGKSCLSWWHQIILFNQVRTFYYPLVTVSSYFGQEPIHDIITWSFVADSQ